MKKEEIDKEQINKFFSLSNKVLKVLFILLIILLILLITYLLNAWQVFSFLVTLLKVISPVFIGFVLAWLLDPLVNRFEKKMPRGVACTLVYLLFLAVLIGIVALFIPSLTSGIRDLVSSLPKTFDSIQGFLADLFEKNKAWSGYQDTILQKIGEFGTGLAKTLPNVVFSFIRNLVSGGTIFFLGLLIGFYLLFNFRKAKGHVLSIMPVSWHENAKDLMRRINGKLRSYVQGVLLVMFFVFITQFIGFSLSGLRAPVVFALFCAITDIIPYIGPWIGGVPAVIIGFTMNPMTGIFTLVSIVVCQILENNFYQPLIMGKAMKLHPVTIILGLLIFSHFFGMIGMIVATPVIACFKIIFEFIEEKTGLSEKLYGYQKKEKKKTVKKDSTKKNLVEEN